MTTARAIIVLLLVASSLVLATPASAEKQPLKRDEQTVLGDSQTEPVLSKEVPDRASECHQRQATPGVVGDDTMGLATAATHEDDTGGRVATTDDTTAAVLTTDTNSGPTSDARVEPVRPESGARDVEDDASPGLPETCGWRASGGYFTPDGWLVGPDGQLPAIASLDIVATVKPGPPTAATVYDPIVGDHTPFVEWVDEPDVGVIPASPFGCGPYPMLVIKMDDNNGGLTEWNATTSAGWIGGWSTPEDNYGLGGPIRGNDTTMVWCRVPGRGFLEYHAAYGSLGGGYQVLAFEGSPYAADCPTGAYPMWRRFDNEDGTNHNSWHGSAGIDPGPNLLGDDTLLNFCFFTGEAATNYPFSGDNTHPSQALNLAAPVDLITNPGLVSGGLSGGWWPQRYEGSNVPGPMIFPDLGIPYGVLAYPGVEYTGTVDGVDTVTSLPAMNFALNSGVVHTDGENHSLFNEDDVSWNRWGSTVPTVTFNRQELCQGPGEVPLPNNPDVVAFEVWWERCQGWPGPNPESPAPEPGPWQVRLELADLMAVEGVIDSITGLKEEFVPDFASGATLDQQADGLATATMTEEHGPMPGQQLDPQGHAAWTAARERMKAQILANWNFYRVAEILVDLGLEGAGEALIAMGPNLHRTSLIINATKLALKVYRFLDAALLNPEDYKSREANIIGGLTIPVELSYTQLHPTLVRIGTGWLPTNYSRVLIRNGPRCLEVDVDDPAEASAFGTRVVSRFCETGKYGQGFSLVDMGDGTFHVYTETNEDACLGLRPEIDEELGVGILPTGVEWDESGAAVELMLMSCSFAGTDWLLDQHPVGDGHIVRNRWEGRCLEDAGLFDGTGSSVPVVNNCDFGHHLERWLFSVDTADAPYLGGNLPPVGHCTVDPTHGQGSATSTATSAVWDPDGTIEAHEWQVDVLYHPLDGEDYSLTSSEDTVTFTIHADPDQTHDTVAVVSLHLEDDDGGVTVLECGDVRAHP